MRARSGLGLYQDEKAVMFLVWLLHQSTGFIHTSFSEVCMTAYAEIHQSPRTQLRDSGPKYCVLCCRVPLQFGVHASFLHVGQTSFSFLRYHLDVKTGDAAGTCMSQRVHVPTS